MPTNNEDGNTSKFEELKRMRERRDKDNPPAVAAVEAAPAVAEVEAEEPVEREVAPAPAPAPAPAVAAPAAPAPAPAPAAPTAVEVTIDGEKVMLSPELADAFTKAEKFKGEATAIADRDALKAELREELKAEFTPPAKSAAEVAAERALAEASAPKKPPTSLSISDPEEYENQRSAFEDWRLEQKLAERDADRLAREKAAAQQAAIEREVDARALLARQFYDVYPVLEKSPEIVNPLFDAKLAELKRSGKVDKPLPPEAREALKKESFAQIAAAATRRLVEISRHGKAVAPPVEAPPTVVASATRAPRPPREVAEKPKEKYPTGSVSSLLARHKAAKEGTAPTV